MDVDETVCYPIAKLLSVRTLACNIGLTTGRKYATRTDRQAGVITVTRKA